MDLAETAAGRSRYASREYPAIPPIAAPPIAAPPAAARPLPLIRPFAAIRPALPAGLAAAGAQLLPSLLFLGFFFVLPAVMLFAYSFLTQSAQGTVGLPVTLEHYRHFFGTALYAHVLWTTLAISLWTTAAAALLGYPVALVMVRASALAARAITMIVIAPLIVSIVVRTYGWEIILGNGPTGVLNWLLLTTGFIHQPLRLLYTQAAVVIGSLHVFFPLMVLPLASALGKIDPSLDEAATTLGATQWRRFRRVTLPLSLPGLAVGATLVFSLTAGSFVTPAILGGTSAQMLGMLVDQQILTVYDWPFGATVASVLVAIVLAINIASMRMLDRRRRLRAL